MLDFRYDIDQRTLAIAINSDYSINCYNKNEAPKQVIHLFQSEAVILGFCCVYGWNSYLKYSTNFLPDYKDKQPRGRWRSEWYVCWIDFTSFSLCFWSRRSFELLFEVSSTLNYQTNRRHWITLYQKQNWYAIELINLKARIINITSSKITVRTYFASHLCLVWIYIDAESIT